MIRGFWAIINGTIWTTLIGTAGSIASLFESNKGKTMGHCARLWAKIILFTCGIPYKVSGLEYLNPKEQYIFAGNHGSLFDIPLAFATIPYWLVPVAKIELRKVPVLGWVMNSGGHIFVDRSSHEKAIISMKNARDSLIKNPRSILLWPEGSRSNDGSISTFKRGGLSISMETGMSVVPVAFFDTYKLHKRGSLKLKKIPVEVRIGKPINMKNYNKDSNKEFIKSIRDAVIKLNSN